MARLGAGLGPPASTASAATVNTRMTGSGEKSFHFEDAHFWSGGDDHDNPTTDILRNKTNLSWSYWMYRPTGATYGGSYYLVWNNGAMFAELESYIGTMGLTSPVGSGLGDHTVNIGHSASTNISQWVSTGGIGNPRTLPYDEWHHLTMVFDGSQTDSDLETQDHLRLRSYYNGVYMDMTTHPNQFWQVNGVAATTPDFAQILNIGYHMWLGTINDEMFLKDLAVWDTSLTDSEVLEIYNSGNLIDLETVAAANNLKIWFDFNENTHPDPQSNSDLILIDKMGNHPDIDGNFLGSSSSFDNWEFTTNIPNA